MLLLCKDLSIARLLPYSTEVEPGLKVGQISEYVGQQEVEQTPQLTQVVLQGRACAPSRQRMRYAFRDVLGAS